jgi:hypothetical protein
LQATLKRLLCPSRCVAPGHIGANVHHVCRIRQCRSGA